MMRGGPMMGQAPEGEAAKPGRAGRERPSSRMMERRVDMMQMMMEQMMQHQQMQESAPK